MSIRCLSIFVLILGVINGVYAQSLPNSLFPNQENYSIEEILQNNTNQGLSSAATNTNQWSLQYVIDLAILNNLELAQSKQELDSAKALYTGSIQDFYLPSLNIGASAEYRDNFTTSDDAVSVAAADGGFRFMSVLPSITLQKRIFNGFATLNSHRIAKENFLNAQNTYSNQIREVVFQTTIRYYNQFLRQEEVSVSLERLRQLRDQLQQAEINFQNGRVSDFDVSLSRSQYYSAEPVYYTAEKNRLVSKEDFFQYIGYVNQPGTYVELQGDLLEVTNIQFSEFDENASIEFILSNDTALSTLRANFANSKSQKGIENSARLPKVDVGFVYSGNFGQSTSFGNNQDFGYNGSYAFQASLQIPVFDWIPGSGVASRVKSAEANVLRSQFALLNAEERKIIEVKSNLLTIRELSQSVISLRVSEEQAAMAAEIARTQYSLGRISLLELNQAQVDYIDAKRNLLASVYNELQAKLTLQQSINNLPRFIEEVNKIQTNNIE